MKRGQFAYLLLLAGFFAGLGTFLDLHVSQMLFSRENLIGVFVNYFAYAPSFIMTFMAAGAIHWHYRKSNPALAWTVLIASALAGAIATDELFEMTWPWLLMVVLVAAGVTYLVFHSLNLQISRQELIIATMFLIAAAGSFSTVSLLKYVWGRMRFIAMSDPASQFTSWYIMRPFSSGNAYASFPSGHVSFTVMVTYLVMLPHILRRDISQSLLFSISVLWIVVVMYGRIVYGAHFLSDVSFGLVNGLLWNWFTQSEARKRINSLGTDKIW